MLLECVVPLAPAVLAFLTCSEGPSTAATSAIAVHVHLFIAAVERPRSELGPGARPQSDPGGHFFARRPIDSWRRASNRKRFVGRARLPNWNEAAPERSRERCAKRRAERPCMVIRYEGMISHGTPACRPIVPHVRQLFGPIDVTYSE